MKASSINREYFRKKYSLESVLKCKCQFNLKSKNI
nr:MAG TPA: hypothetical protein [Caudoviricetes sp.]